MTRHRCTLTSLIVFACALIPVAQAQDARIVNGHLQARPGAALEREFRALVAAQTAPAWIGYTVPIVEGRHHICCSGNSESFTTRDDQVCCGACALEGDRADARRAAAPTTGPITLEENRALVVLFRVEAREVRRVRIFSQDCTLDAGGLPVHWLTGASPAESVKLLLAHATGGGAGNEGKEGKEGRRVSDEAVSAIALHADGSADRALDGLAAAPHPEELRRKAVFWLGSARGRHGYDSLTRIVRDDPSDKVREHAIFALSISKVPEAVDAMINVARNDRSAHVRGQALFWLGQKAGRKAIATLTEAIENDPETDIKKKAVFGLSQLPKDQGVPLLINVARTHANPAVRKQAIFWLGQSQDARALSFFEEVLRR